MYDAYARKLIDSIPNLPNIDRDECRRALSAAYFYSVHLKFSVQIDTFQYSDLERIKFVLRGLVDALECVAVFDVLNGVERTSKEQLASAFVAAEALSLLANFPQNLESSDVYDVLFAEENYVAVEAALLYMVGGYDINAVSIVQDVEVPVLERQDVLGLREARLSNAAYVLDRILAFCRGQVRRSQSDFSLVNVSALRVNPAIYEKLLDKIRGLFYEQLGNALDAYLEWLGGYKVDGYQQASQTLLKLRDMFTHNSEYNVVLADIYHLISLVLAAIERTKERALLYNVPYPDKGNAVIIQDYLKYLQFRARGTQRNKGRPFLWPSTLTYVNDCLPGPTKDSIIAMPTGSGKSFLAELAITHALCSGWVLYLAPTNALAHQIRRDLNFALSPFEQVDVRAFVGAEEYTTLSEDTISPDRQHFVAVMTPEKCALAVRLYPERFATCSLCVFDECHLLNDGDRGVTADILIAQLCLMAPKIRFVLMSAMLSNSDELVGWLSAAHNVPVVAPPLKWRPSRTLRGLLILDQDSLNNNYQAAKSKLAQLSERRKNVKFDVSLALLAGLSGPWTTDGAIDYRVVSLPISFEAKASRSINPSFESWKNTAARLQAELLARSGISTLCFILTSRHHAFSSAGKIKETIPGTVEENEEFEPLVKAWLSISDAELGIETILWDLLRKGIAVHTSAMLQPEQAASEWMFSQRKARLMFATPTLAQGLNLPALGVVVAGTTMGDPRNIDKIAGLSRVNALILNSFGRAGRPGISNQGIAILVTDKPNHLLGSEDSVLQFALDKYTVLKEEDASVEVISPIVEFLDHILEKDITVNEATSTELTLTSLLAEYDEENQSASEILLRTLAAHQNRQRLSSDAFVRVQNRVFELKHNFIEQPGVPNWINRAAMKAGVGFLHAWRMWQAYQELGVNQSEASVQFTIIEWFDIFFAVMALLSPTEVSTYFAHEEVKTPSVLTDLRDLASNLRDVNVVPWDRPDNWKTVWLSLKDLVLMYMQGHTYADMARVYLRLPSDSIIENKRSSGRHPIPAIFGFLRRIVNTLAIDAGCFVAIYELCVNGEASDAPDALKALPLCVRNGCDSLGSLSWYRFGYRERVCAHAFQKSFPVPYYLTDDNARAVWVRKQRKAWLEGHILTDIPILEYAKVVIQEGRNV